ncbi:MAG: hypothetical protein IPH07_16985 [Deltaproteobacteria bacterium]|nr:hypothetical protein [Deltaproteobacteria bacterium]MBK8239461.1 hypothetical protein [Deltaproteobacteria bacterium]MBK8719257.1 hypothetical protein [Deltaproteobacteria bacterium]MBP7291214.1 hypothetical protein [Nannocystaceae bacterium]
MRPLSRFFSGLTVLALSLTGCATAYSSFYKETNHKLHPAPIAAKDVRVVKSRDDLKSAWTELGVYRGHAPTVAEAMDAAKQQCGSHGADLYILNTAPFQSEASWKVDGVCGRRDGK